MPSGNEIIVSSPPLGRFISGIISGTPKPGTMMQIQAGTAPVNGLFTWEAYAPGTDGDRLPVVILLDDELQGKLATEAYVSGTEGRLYAPANGEELNILFGNAAGTGDDVAIGDLLMGDTGTGKLINTTGDPESEPFQALEAITDPTADQLLWAMYTGY